MNAAEHLERHLGPIATGWSSDTLPGVQVCLFRDQPSEGVATLATLGLSNSVLSMSNGRGVRQELIIGATALDATRCEELAKVLMHVAAELLASKRALLRGEVIPLEHQVAGSASDTLYASIPVVFSEGLATLPDSAPPTVIVWLIPLLSSESNFVRVSGWSSFEDRLETSGVDLFDLARDPVV